MQRTGIWALCGAGILLGLDGFGGLLVMFGADLPFWGRLFVLVDAIALAGVAVWLYSSLIMRRWARREPIEIVRSDRMSDLGWGLLGGVAFIVVCVAIVAATGSYRVAPASWFGVLDVVDVLTLVVVSAVLEELLFRGVLLQALERWLGWVPALAITSVLFGAAHLANPGASLAGALAIAVEAGFLLGAVFLWRRSLVLAIGVHAGWNAAESFLGIPVSGQAPHGFLHVTAIGPDVLTGGAFGIEASVVPMVVGAVVGIVLLARRRLLDRRARTTA